jgi:methylthioribose-1-phosphate isomerase
VVTTVDQTRLPRDKIVLRMEDCSEVEEAIKNMRIRGAPLIGVAAAYGLALTAYNGKSKEKKELIQQLSESAKNLTLTRPTAVNLFWAVERIMKKVEEMKQDSPTRISSAVVEEAKKIADEDFEVNRRIGKHGSPLIENGDTVLTYCNAGGLATSGYGTALGVLRAAWAEGTTFKVIAAETRPLLQGARLTAYELQQEGIPVTVITDNATGYIMSKGMIDLIIVGADRVLKDAVINKIGTYTLAVLARTHNIPFYVAAPSSTFDFKRLVNDVEVEERNQTEVLRFQQLQIAPEGVNAYNPAFDITPMQYIKGIIWEKGISSPKDLQERSDFL